MWREEGEGGREEGGQPALRAKVCMWGGLGWLALRAKVFPGSWLSLRAKVGDFWFALRAAITPTPHKLCGLIVATSQSCNFSGIGHESSCVALSGGQVCVDDSLSVDKGDCRVLSCSVSSSSHASPSSAGAR